MTAKIEKKGSLVRVECDGDVQIFRSMDEAFHDAYDRRLESDARARLSRQLSVWRDLESMGDLPSTITRKL